ncbi:hypothetical protein COL922a_013945 [Colletotrichum nupharicola]|nr:hypothetical protein COL922a_013945 [Colletotrichum nupharicola]
MTIQAHRRELDVGKETAEVVPVALGYSAMEDLESSTVYEPSITKVLAQLFHMNCQLSALLARVISLTYGYEHISLEGDTASWSQWLSLRIECLKSDLAL